MTALSDCPPFLSSGRPDASVQRDRSGPLRHRLAVTVVSACAALTACGGGTDSTQSNTGSSSGTRSTADLINWNGNAAGPWVYLSNSGIIGFTASTRQIYDYDSKALGAMRVDTAAKITHADGSPVGASVKLAPNGMGSYSATVSCENGALARLLFSGTIPYVDCTANSTPTSTWSSSTSPGTSTSGSGATGSTGSGSGSSGTGTGSGSGSSGSGTSGTTEVVQGAIVAHGWISNTRYYVDVKNTGNVANSCIVNFQYDLPNTAFRDSIALSTGYLVPGQTGRVLLYNTPELVLSNIRFSSPYCSKWPF